MQVTIREMRAILGNLDTVLSNEGEILVTNHGRAIARILPLKEKRQRPTHAALHQLMKKQTIPSEILLREERDDR